MKTISFDAIMAMEKRYRTTFINSIAGFKSLNLVGSIDTNGKTNLAIFNSIFHVGANPPYLGMVFRPDEVERHTLENILLQKHYTLNHVNPSIVSAAHQTSARYSKNISEFEACGLTPFYSGNIIAPYVQESNVKIGLSLKEKLHVESNKTIIIIGQVTEIIIDENYISDDGFVNLEALDTCTVVGLDAYYKASRIERLAYAKPDMPSIEIL
jgi:flavin reductase (DIM6/NTAB) family NADH-FMN oxidoreductase RutF